MYGIGIVRKNKEDYVLPFQNLKDIDAIFLEHSKQEILETLKQNDSVITEDDPELLKIEKYVHGKWRDPHIDIIQDQEILNFSFESLFNHPKDAHRILNILYNHFSSYLKKEYIRTEFKEAIEAMKVSSYLFLEKLKLLKYDEIREIRVYLSKKIHLQDLENEEVSSYCLQRKVEEKKAS